MKTLSKFTATSLVFAALLFAGTGDALAGKTHLGQKVEQHLTLTWGLTPGQSSCGNTDFGFVEVPPDGAAGQTAYQIPEGYAFVVTEIDWVASGFYALGQMSGIEVYFNASPWPRVVNQSHSVDSTMVAAQRDAGTIAMTTGFLWKSGAELCVRPYMATANSGTAMELRQAVLRGYLTKVK